MLYLRYHADSGKGLELPLHVGDKINSRISSINFIQADGDELGAILRTFKNIPHSEKPVQIWTGEWANYIGKNLETWGKV